MLAAHGALVAVTVAAFIGSFLATLAVVLYVRRTRK